MRKSITAISLCIIMSMLTAVAFAGNASISADYDAASNVVSTTGSAYGYATVRIMPHADSAGALSDSNPPTDIYQFGANGSFTQKTYMPIGASYGKYVAYLTDDDSSVSDTFVYYDKANADNIVRTQINPTSSESAFVDAIVPSNALALGIDVDEADFSERALRLMYALDVTYTDSADFYNHYNYCKAIIALSGKSGSALLAKLEEYDTVLGIDFDADYTQNSKLTTSAKAYLLTALSSMDYAADVKSAQTVTGETGFKAVYLAKSALASLMTTESHVTVQDIYTKTYSFLNNNVVNANTAYSALSPSAVFSNLAKLTFDDISDLKANFDSAVLTTANENDRDSSRKPSSGGGGYTAPSAPNGGVYDEVPGVEAIVPTELSLPQIADGAAAYSDVSSADWYYAPVSALGASGIISGDPSGSFRPSDSITRAEFAKLIVSAFSVKGAKKSFADVAADAWYEPYVSVAAGVGILQGYEGNFNPASYITRQDAAVIIYRTANLLGIAYGGFSQPTDINDASVYAWTAIGSLYSSGIISGMGDGSFAPLSNITRAQAAQLIYSTIADMQTRK